MNIEKINELIEKDMAEVNRIIHKELWSEITLINNIIHHIMNSGGKRIRPIMTVLTARALNFKGKKHIKIAALIEFIHTATLLHDDVVDESNIRRGKISANLEFGNAASVLVGDFIYTRAFQMITALHSLRVLSLMSEAVNVIAQGEVLQLINCNDPNITIENYMNIVSSKTARLFEVASQSSAIIAGANIQQEIALRNYGRHLGTSFQLIDDLLDYCINSKNIDKNIGNDLNSGKLTLPLLHAIHNGTLIQSSFIKKIIEKGNGRHLLTLVIEILHQCGSLEYTRKCAKNEAKKAIASLKCLSPSLYKHALESLAYIVVNRES